MLFKALKKFQFKGFENKKINILKITKKYLWRNDLLPTEPLDNDALRFKQRRRDQENFNKNSLKYYAHEKMSYLKLI